MRSHFFATLLIVSICGVQPLFWTSTAFAFVIPPKITQLVERSDMVILAKVDSVRGWEFLKSRRAKATVLEVWKGPKVSTVEYHVSPTFVCDTSDARRGETVLLFLDKQKDGTWRIAWSGRGRMPLVRLKDKDFLSYHGVIFPEETPRIETPKDSEGFGAAVELNVVKEQVQKAVNPKK